jgi:xanthine dehydrogenase YagT iron-sulfur-binding subunit
MDEPFTNITRREFLVVSAAAATAATAATVQAQGATLEQVSYKGSPDALVSSVQVSLKINGEQRSLVLDTRTTLLDVLREHVHLTGTKKGCDHGQCGACTVLINGRRINSCLTLAVMHQGDEITSIEGLGNPEHMHPMQAAFVKHDGFQCGYCTPGQICSAVGMLDEVKRGSPSHVSGDLLAQPLLSNEELRERMSGNICRCGAYSNIAEAISEVAAGGAA